jgi:folate-binding Fe-S cluster repair protein YgfZ
MTLPLVVSAGEPVAWTLLEARGDDTRAFLQGQLSCDVLSIVAGQSVDGLLLTPSGGVITSLRCSYHPEGIDIAVRAEISGATTSALRRFLMRTRCGFREAGAIAGPYTTVGEQVRRGEPGPNEFALGVSAHAFGQEFVERHVSFTKGCYTGQEMVGRLDARAGTFLSTSRGSRALISITWRR